MSKAKIHTSKDKVCVDKLRVWEAATLSILTGRPHFSFFIESKEWKDFQFSKQRVTMQYTDILKQVTSNHASLKGGTFAFDLS